MHILRIFGIYMYCLSEIFCTEINFAADRRPAASWRCRYRALEWLAGRCWDVCDRMKMLSVVGVEACRTSWPSCHMAALRYRQYSVAETVIAKTKYDCDCAATTSGDCFDFRWLSGRRGALRSSVPHLRKTCIDAMSISLQVRNPLLVVKSNVFSSLKCSRQDYCH